MLKKTSTAAILLMLNLNIAMSQPFFSVGGGTNQGIYSLFADTLQNVLYAGGLFSYAGNIQCKTIAKWNGIEWDSLRNNLSGDVRGINILNNELYIEGALGMFDSTLSQWIGGPLRLNSLGNAWTGLSPDFANGFWNIVNYNNSLYFMGTFDSIGGIYSSKIVRYDGNNWYPFPPLDTNGGGWTIINARFYNGNLYVGGNFESQVGPNMLDIAKWDGAQWLPVGNGLSGGSTSVWAFATYQGKLIIGGYFNTAWGDPGNNIAAWDGTSWTQLGTGLNGEVQSLVVYNNELWVGGVFSNAGGVPASYLAKWDGSNWHSLGINLNGTVLSMAVLGNDLYIAGGFYLMDGDTVNYIIRYNYLTGFETLNSSKRDLIISPNPFTESIKITHLFSNEQLIIKNVFGETVYQKKLSSGNTEEEFNLSFLQQGVYFLNVKSNGESYTKKIVKM